MNKWKYKAVLVLFGVVMGVAMGEVLLRLFAEPQAKRLSIYDPHVGWRGRPHGRGMYVMDFDDIRVPYAYNNYGFRDDDIETRLPGAPRIVMLGDSFLECLEMDYENIYHEQVERRLQQTVHKDASVMAVGAQGFATSQELLAYRKFKDALDADIVLTMFFTGNDFENNQRKLFAYLDDEGDLVFPQNEHSWIYDACMQSRRWLYENSYFVFYAKNGLQICMNLNLGTGTKVQARESEQYKQKITKQLILQSKRDVEANGACYGVIVMVSKEEIRNGDFGKSQMVVNWCQENSIPVLDLSRAVTLDNYFPIDRHFNETGHDIVSEKIVDFLVEAYPSELTDP